MMILLCAVAPLAAAACGDPATGSPPEASERAACPRDLSAVDGTQCPEPGQACGRCGECETCWLATCEDGTWRSREVFAADECGCPADLAAADGTACDEPGKSCGGCDVCETCWLATCDGGVWSALEVFPQDGCGADAGAADAAAGDAAVTPAR
jgi:hypothetical protein